MKRGRRRNNFFRWDFGIIPQVCLRHLSELSRGKLLMNYITCKIEKKKCKNAKNCKRSLQKIKNASNAKKTPKRKNVKTRRNFEDFLP